MDSSNVKYNCRGVLLQDYYPTSFHFQSDLLSYVFQWGMESWGRMRIFLVFFFHENVGKKQRIHMQNNIRLPQCLHSWQVSVPVSCHSPFLQGRSVPSEAFSKMQWQSTDYQGS